ncbi:autotransporter-associated beta strand repeat-containing protein, partial [bacterium]|nr:autotransporter-associated beta strand repeat-containing protein [bacterium]
VISIDPGTTTPGTLNIDDGAVAGNIVVAIGDHLITAPVAVDAQGVKMDIGASSDTTPAPYSLTVSGVVSGASAALTKTGGGNLFLNGSNTYGGGTLLSAGLISINSATSLGDIAGAATFSGGSLQLSAPLTGITRSYAITGANSAIIDTNGNDFGYGGVISPLSGGTGGLTKRGAGIMTLTAAQAYTGTTAVGGGQLLLDTGAAITAGTVDTTLAGGGLISTRNGGTLTGTTGFFNAGSGGLFMDVASGNVSFSGAVFAMNTTSNGNGAPIRVTSGSLSAPSIQLGRSGLSTTAEPTAAPVNTNLYLSGGAVTLSGDLIVGTSGGSSAPQSSVVTRVDGGTLTVGGAISVGLNNGGRWSYIDINGGTLVNNGAVTDSGVVLGGPLVGKAAFLMRAGTATVERIQFGRGAVDGQGLLNISGGVLYVGSGGISLGSTGIYTSEVRLSGGTLGAKAAWTSTLPVNLTLPSTLKAADASNAAFDIALSGALSGAGGFDKTGAGTLTLAGANSYLGATTVTAGALVVAGDSSLATGAVTVASTATLGGNGNLGGNVTIQSGGRHSLAIGATPGTQATRLITGTLTLDAGNILDLTAAATPADGTYVLATVTGGITGTPTTVNLPGGVSGTVAINGNNLEFTVGSGGYSSWASTNGLTGANNGPTQDPDNDGIANSLEFALGGNPLASSTGVLPVLTTDATNFIFTFTRQDASEAEVTLNFQYGSNLAGWTDVAIGATSSAGVNIVEGDAVTDVITVTIAKGANTTLFGRLKAVK